MSLNASLKTANCCTSLHKIMCDDIRKTKNTPVYLASVSMSG